MNFWQSSLGMALISLVAILVVLGLIALAKSLRFGSRSLVEIALDHPRIILFLLGSSISLMPVIFALINLAGYWPWEGMLNSLNNFILRYQGIPLSPASESVAVSSWIKSMWLSPKVWGLYARELLISGGLVMSFGLAWKALGVLESIFQRLGTFRLRYEAIAAFFQTCVGRAKTITRTVTLRIREALRGWGDSVILAYFEEEELRELVRLLRLKLREQPETVSELRRVLEECLVANYQHLKEPRLIMAIRENSRERHLELSPNLRRKLWQYGEKIEDLHTLGALSSILTSGQGIVEELERVATYGT